MKQIEISQDDDVRIRICRAAESGYRRGVSQALSRAADMVRAGATARDLDLMTELSMEMRYDHERHPTYLDELNRRYAEAKRGRRSK